MDEPFAPSELPEKRPQSVSEIFWVFNRMALQGFGGVLAVAQIELVDRTRWMTRSRFMEVLSAGQVLPGPNIINMALMIGDGFFGRRGAAAACAGLLISPLVIVLVLAALYAEFAYLPVVSGALRGMGAVAAGLVISTAFKLASTLKGSPLGVPVAAAFAALTFIAIGILHWPLLWVMIGLGPLSIGLAWRNLK